MGIIYNILHKINEILCDRKLKPMDDYLFWPSGAITRVSGKFTKVLVCKNGNDTMQLYELEDI